MIAIVDYGIGNLGSVTKGFRHAGAETVLTGDPEVLRSASALVLPGDGAFGATMEEIRRRGLARPIEEAAAQGVPVLGICIGMQVLFEDFFWALADHGRINIHLELIRGRNAHHIAETLYKSASRALSMAVALDPRVKGIPSTKGAL